MSRSATLPLLLGGLVLFGGAACDSDPPITPTPTTTPPPLSLACPATVSVAADAAPVVVDYTAPTPSGGAAPVQVSCTVPTRSDFPHGTTDVICTATDALQRTAQCTFSVEVAVTRRLAGTKVLAFGDSLTAGEVAQPVPTLHVFDQSRSYPTVLQQKLRERYPAQADEIVVINHGELGETVPVGNDRLPGDLVAIQPDVLLLLEGSNDANGGGLTPDQIAGLLLDDVQSAFALGVPAVFLSTLPPEVPGRPRAFAPPERIVAINDAIRAVVNGTGAVLVDTYAAFEPQKEILIGDDGLHPTAEGYELLADLFLEAITEHLEEPTETGLLPAGARPPPGLPFGLPRP